VVEAAHVDASDERAVGDHLDEVDAKAGGIDILCGFWVDV
jgi:hypothetical protein